MKLRLLPNNFLAFFVFFSLIFLSWIRIHSPDDDDYGTLARARFLDLRCIFLASVASLVGL